MPDRKIFLCWLLLGQILLVNVVYSAKLADSGYPMAGANPQRNYQFNRKVLCPNVSGGKSTILNVAWVWPPSNFPLQWDSVAHREITMDADGYIYLAGYVFIEGNGLQSKVFKIHSSGNASLTTMTNSVPLEQSVYTHLEGGLYYSANDNATFAWNPDLSLNTRIDNVFNSLGPSSVAPLGSDYLVKSNDGSETDPALTFIKVPENTIDVSNNPNFIVGYTTPVMVYKNATHEFPIVVSNTSPATFTSMYYNGSLPRESAKAMIDSSEIISITQNTAVKIYRISAETGVILEEKSVTVVTGESVSLSDPSKFLYHNGRSFADVSLGDEHAFADLYNDELIVERTGEMLTQPTYSTVDNVMIATLYRGNLEFWGLGWGTWDVKMKAVGPEFNSATGFPIFSEGCKMHVVVDQHLYTLEPLPVQNVVPILECIDPEWGVGYFSYENLGQREFQIPVIQDRNFVAAVNDTPITLFKLGHGPTYPLSNILSLPLENSTYTWQLENYLLSFNPSDSKLYCPTTVNLTIVLTADAPFPASFNQKVRSTFVSVTGISDSRVTIVTSSKRSTTQSSELETELSIAPDPNNVENSPAQVVTEFATNQRDAFNQQISAADGAPANVTVSSVTTKPLASQIRGSTEETPLAPPSTPTNEPQESSQEPQAVPSPANFLSGIVAVYWNSIFTVLLISAVRLP